MQRQKLMALLRLAALPAIIGIAALVGWKLGYFELDRRQRLFETVQRLRVLRFVEVWYLVGSAIALAIGLPSAILSLLGGAVFGFKVGALLSWGASMIGTVMAHMLAHTVAHGPITRIFGDHRLLRLLRTRGDVRTLFRLRLIPAAPFAVLAYIAGVAGVSVRRLVIASALGILPSVLAYAYAGAAVMRGMVSADDASGRALWAAGAITVLMIGVSLVAGRRRPSE